MVNKVVVVGRKVTIEFIDEFGNNPTTLKTDWKKKLAKGAIQSYTLQKKPALKQG